jgi:hypothetical protein
MRVRFLTEAADSNGSVSVFECFVPADSRMPAPHRTTRSRRRSNGSKVSPRRRLTAAPSRSVSATPSACPGGSSTNSRTRAPRTRSCWRSPARGSCVPTTSVRSTKCWRQVAGLLIQRSSGTSCAGTGSRRRPLHNRRPSRSTPASDDKPAAAERRARFVVAADTKHTARCRLAWIRALRAYEPAAAPARREQERAENRCQCRATCRIGKFMLDFPSWKASRTV